MFRSHGFLRALGLSLLSALFFTACGDDDENPAPPANNVRPGTPRRPAGDNRTNEVEPMEPDNVLHPNAEGDRYIVSVQNLTAGQPLSPPMIGSTVESPKAFTEGDTASPELQQLAEEGISLPLAAFLESHARTLQFTNLQASIEPNEPILPGQTQSYELMATKEHCMITIAAMLASTNDAFFYVTKNVNDLGEEASMDFVVHQAYDAGTERNSELCTFIPGAPCMSHLKHDPAPSEGRVSRHPGISGSGELALDRFSWTDIARITIRKAP